MFSPETVFAFRGSMGYSPSPPDPTQPTPSRIKQGFMDTPFGNNGVCLITSESLPSVMAVTIQKYKNHPLSGDNFPTK